MGVGGIMFSGCLAVRPCVSASVRQSICSPLDLPNEWRYFNETDRN